jgi:hypothetical protein
MNNELEGMQKELARAKFKAVSQYLPGGLIKTTENLSEDIQSLGQDLNNGPPKYEGVANTHL